MFDIDAVTQVQLREEFPEASVVAQTPQVSFRSYSQFHQIKAISLLILGQ